MKVKVYEITDKDLHWHFDSDKYPTFITHGYYKHSVRVDPFPCYQHSVKLVRKTLRECINKYSIRRDLNVYVSSFEEPSRTNGCFFQEFDYNSKRSEYDDEYSKWSGTIVLSGKRIVPMPSLTRYVSSHEYGHAVFYDLKSRTGLTLDEYAKMRGYKTKIDNYGGKTWHASISEIFANDVRILLFEKEVDFWPHSVKRPEKCKEVIDFFKEIDND